MVLWCWAEQVILETDSTGWETLFVSMRQFETERRLFRGSRMAVQDTGTGPQSRSPHVLWLAAELK